MDSFTEHGSLALLDIDRRDAESIRSAVGFRASYDWKLGGVVIKPEVRAAWQHEYGDKSYDFSASFAGGAGDQFLVNGPKSAATACSSAPASPSSSAKPARRTSTTMANSVVTATIAIA